MTTIRTPAPGEGATPIDCWTMTATGAPFYPLRPRESVIDFEVIAQALSRVARWNGHTTKPWTVAQHSLAVCEALEFWGESKAVQLQGLLHDASEAYLPDVPSPIKVHLTNFHAIEDEILCAIFNAAGLTDCESLYGTVKQADRFVLEAERATLLPFNSEWIPALGFNAPGYTRMRNRIEYVARRAYIQNDGGLAAWLWQFNQLRAELGLD